MARLKQYRWKIPGEVTIEETGMVLNKPTFRGMHANYDMQKEKAVIILAAREEGSGHDTPYQIEHVLNGAEEGLDTAAVSAIVRYHFPDCEEEVLK